MFVEEIGADCEIYYEGNPSLKFNKALVSCRSTYFKDVIDAGDHDKLFALGGEVRQEIMKEVLRFLYCGKVELVGAEVQFLGDLLIAACKFQVDQVKEICCDRLVSKLNEITIEQIFEAAKTSQCERLLQACKDFETLT